MSRPVLALSTLLLFAPTADVRAEADGSAAASDVAPAAGQDDVTAAHAAPDGKVANEEPANSAEQEQFIEAVTRIEAEGGAWDPALAEQLLGLGAAYQRQGRHEEAVRVLSRAAHITRINEGLYAASDIPIVERLIESEAVLGDWETVSGNYQQLFQIHQRNFGERDPRLLPVLRNLSAWHLRAWMDSLGKEPLNHLMAARNLYDSSLEILHSSYGATDTRQIETLRERAIVDWYLANSVAPERPVPTVSFGMGGSGPPGYQEEDRAAAIVANGFFKGREALEQVVALRQGDPGSTLLDSGKAIAELADWNLLFARRQTAMSLYRDAQAPLLNGGTEGAQAFQDLFGTPLELPVLPRHITRVSGAPRYNAWILIDIAVDENGKAGAMEIVKAEPTPPDGQLQSLRRRLRYAQFRPRFEGSGPVATSALRYRYRYAL